MKLMAPIVITPPNITKANGEVKVFSPITIDKLDVTVIDNSDHKVCMAQIRPCPKPLVLWEKEAYDAIGDYTQAQVDARVSELLGNNPAVVLNGLFHN